MLDLKWIKENPEKLKVALARRGTDIFLDDFFQLEARRREILTEVENLRCQRNNLSEEIARAKKEKKDVSGLLQGSSNLKHRIMHCEEALPAVEEKIKNFLLFLPNLPDASVPLGKGPEDNKVLRYWGEIKEFSFPARDHQDLGELLGIIDFPRAAKLSGSRFALLTGQGALLERALINFMLDVHIREHGYKEVFPPFLVNKETMQGTGQLPKFEEELYRCSLDDLYLIPTAEVPLTNLHRQELLSESELPLNYVAYTACFRREAGSYGKDTRGLIRNHQFNKIELVKFVRPEDASEQLEKLLADAEHILQYLNLAYRVVLLCSSDLGFAAAKTYDLEIWLPGEKKWREVSSCSCFSDFQARRLNIKFQRKNGEKQLVYTLNGSGLAVGRTFAAILENYQNPDGSINIPAVLQPYFGGQEVIK